MRQVAERGLDWTKLEPTLTRYQSLIGPTVQADTRKLSSFDAFKTGLRAWATRQGIPWLEFQKGERKDDVVQRYRARFGKCEGVVCVGVAQEKAKTWSATKAVRERSVQVAYRWKTVCVNHDYLYVLDRERGPALLG